MLDEEHRPMLAFLDVHKARAEFQHAAAGADQVLGARQQPDLAVVEHQPVDPPEHFQHVLAVVEDPVIKMSPAIRCAVILIDDPQLDFRGPVGEELGVWESSRWHTQSGNKTFQIIGSYAVPVQMRIEILSASLDHGLTFLVVGQVVFAYIHQVGEVGAAIGNVPTRNQRRMKCSLVRIGHDASTDRHVINQAVTEWATAGQVDANLRPCRLAK